MKDYDFDQEHVNAPAACGDTKKYTATYKIGDYNFKYWHTCGDGEIGYSKFSIKYDDKKETLFVFSMMTALKIKIGLTKDKPTIIDKDLLNNFMEKYGGDDISKYFYFFGVLNSFTFGHCYNLIENDEHKLELFYVPLEDMIDVLCDGL